jgi:UDP-N-acetylglucosamine diphosphorylase/glucosamine-1-phosphate N-acetyltransferase
MKLVFHDNGLHQRFSPLTLTRPLSELRMGLFTNTERWQKMLQRDEKEWVGFVTERYLATKFPSPDDELEYIHINSAIVPNAELADEVNQLNSGEELRDAHNWIARKGRWNASFVVKLANESPVVEIQHIWDLFQQNHKVLTADFFFCTKNRISQKLSSSNTVIGEPSLVFLEEGAVVEASILNTLAGPIYVGKDAEIMEGSMIRGGLALCEHAALKMGAKLYGATSIGPHCKVGGEVSNSIFMGYANKGHDGFLGNSVIGEWCNLGADTNSSNLKNNYSTVSVYSYETQRMEQSDVQFLGVLMGDHSKTGINTMLNTATVIGVSANVFGAEFPPKYVPSFAWGSYGETRFELEKACETAHHMMQRRGLHLTTADKAILHHLFEQE